jgi:site-specific recombinase XerD
MRHPKPYWKASHQCWYVKIDGQHKRLDPDEEKAWEEYHKLMAGRMELSPDSRVSELINQFLDWSERNHAAGTYRWYEIYLLAFGKSLPPGLKLSRLKPFHLTRWLDRTCPAATTSPSTRHGAIRAVQRAFNWAEEQGLTDRNPLRKVKKPRPNRRENYLWPEQYDQFLGLIKDEPFRDIVEILRHTGCRPEEARVLTAAEFNQRDRCWDLPVRFTAKTTKARAVPLNDRAFEICERRAERFPKGPIFRNIRNDPWRKNALVDRCRRLRTKIDFYVSPYTIRHTFATDAIIRGVDLITIAEIMGHADLEMLQSIYQHVSQRSDHIRRGMEKATEHLTDGGPETPLRIVG